MGLSPVGVVNINTNFFVVRFWDVAGTAADWRLCGHMKTCNIIATHTLTFVYAHGE